MGKGGQEPAGSLPLVGAAQRARSEDGRVRGRVGTLYRGNRCHGVGGASCHPTREGAWEAPRPAASLSAVKERGVALAPYMCPPCLTGSVPTPPEGTSPLLGFAVELSQQPDVPHLPQARPKGWGGDNTSPRPLQGPPS